MKARKVTVAVLVGGGFLLAAFDSLLALNSEEDDTISEVTDHAIHKAPWIAFLLGYLMGHLTWAQRPKRET